MLSALLIASDRALASPLVDALRAHGVDPSIVAPGDPSEAASIVLVEVSRGAPLPALRVSPARLIAFAAEGQGAEEALFAAIAAGADDALLLPRDRGSIGLRVAAAVGAARKRGGAERAFGLSGDALLEALVENLPFDVWALDREGRYVLQNSNSRRTWGDFLGKKTEDIVGEPGAVAAWVARNARALSGELVSGGVAISLPAGDRYYDTLIAPVRRDGEVLGAIGANIEVTERKRAEIALRKSESLLRAFFDAAPIMMGAVSIEGDDMRIVSANRALAREMGVPIESLAGRRGSESVASKAALTMWLSRFREVLSQGRPVRFEYQPGTGERLDRWLSVTMARVPTAPGEPPCCCFMVEDVTSRKQIEARLAVADRMASLGALASGVGHEINNPLAYVLMNLTFVVRQLARFADAPPSAESVEHARGAAARAIEGAERIKHIVRDLRVLSRLEDEERGPVDLSAVLAGAVDAAQTELGERARVTSEIGPLPPIVAGEARLARALENLVVYAGQQPREGGSPPTVAVRARVAHDGRAFLEIAADGEGPAPEILPRLFEPFFSARLSGEGTGLGLAISHAVVTSLGGEIGVDGSPRRGTRFWVLLPPAPTDASLGDLEGPPSERGARRRASVLVVDDENEVGDALRASLSADHDVSVERSGGGALARLARGERFDVILCDLLMPELTGMDVYERMAQVAPDQREAVVFITGGAATPRARAFLQSVDRPCLQKPFDLDALRSLVARRARRARPG